MSKYSLHIAAIAFSLLLLASCSSTRYLPQGKYLLWKNEVQVTEKKKPGASKSAVSPYIRQQANKSGLFGIRFPLGIYNASPRCDSCWWGVNMKKMGEAPVVFEPNLVDNSVKNIGLYLRSVGYYNAVVKDSIRYSGHKAKVTYIVTPGERVTIRKINYQIEDSILRPFIMSDTASSLIKRGSPLSVSLLENESKRIESFMHNKGFYSFNRNLVSYTADTLADSKKAELTIRLFQNETAEAIDSMQYNTRFRIRHVNIYTEYDAVKASTDTDYMTQYTGYTAKETPGVGNVNVFYRDKMHIRTSVLLNTNIIEPGEYYSGAEITQVQNNFSNLRLYHVAAIRFDKVPPAAESDSLLDCTIYLTPISAQNFNLKMEASISGLGLFGLSPNISYNHRNLFRGAEWLNVTFSDNYQFDPFHISDNKRRSNELAFSASIGMPRFLLPYIGPRFRSYSPRTEFTTSYGYQLRPEYTRNSMSFLLGYNWRTKPQFSYIVNLLNVNIVKLYDMTTDFYNSIEGDPYLRNRYEDHFVLGANASFLYSTRQAANLFNSIQLRWNVAVAGNVLSAFNNLMPKNDNGNHLLLGTPYSQYAKTDVNVSYYQVFNKRHTLAYRFFIGVGRAYGNSISLPYEEVYYSGGAYSLRGWQSRSVGPGAAPMDTTFSIPNQVGDFKLEANIEYRFNLSGMFEGAVFMDAGNVWSLNYDEADELAVFRGSSFYKQIALNTGIGLRLNLGFTAIRLDLGAKLYEPRQYSGWVAPRNILSLNNLALHLGIGYPF